MKKLTVLFTLVSVAALAYAKDPNFEQRLAAKLEATQAQAQQAAQDVHDDAVVDMVLSVSSAWENPINAYSAREHTYEKPCSAVRVDKNWLLASLACRGVGETATAYDHNGQAYDKKVAYRRINGARIRSKASHARDTITKSNIFVDETAQIILLKLNLANEDLADEMEGVDVAKLLIPAKPVQVATDYTDAYINRERCGLPGRCSDSVGIDGYCTKNQCFRTEWELIDGDAGDPLFVLKGNREFLVGFNNAVINGEDSQSGRWYRTFNHNTLQALQSILTKQDPAAWKRVSQQISQSL